MQVEAERLGDKVRIVAGRPAGPARASGNARWKAWSGRE